MNRLTTQIRIDAPTLSQAHLRLILDHVASVAAGGIDLAEGRIFITLTAELDPAAPDPSLHHSPANPQPSTSTTGVCREAR